LISCSNDLVRALLGSDNKIEILGDPRSVSLEGLDVRDVFIIESVDADGKTVKRVLLVVTYRELIDRYWSACHKAGINLSGIDLEAFGLLRALGAPVEMIGVARGDEPTPAFCFARTGSCEIELGGRKVVGSAQRRYGATFLQHGSILLGIDLPCVGAVFPTTPDPLATLTTLEAALGHRPKFDDVAQALAAAFEGEHGLDLRPEGLTAEETEAVERLVREKYATDAWLCGPA